MPQLNNLFFVLSGNRRASSCNAPYSMDKANFAQIFNHFNTTKLFARSNSILSFGGATSSNLRPRELCILVSLIWSNITQYRIVEGFQETYLKVAISHMILKRICHGPCI